MSKPVVYLPDAFQDVDSVRLEVELRNAIERRKRTKNLYSRTEYGYRLQVSYGPVPLTPADSIVEEPLAFLVLWAAPMSFDFPDSAESSFVKLDAPEGKMVYWIFNSRIETETFLKENFGVDQKFEETAN